MNVLYKDDIKKKMIYEQFLLLDVSIPKICIIVGHEAFRNKLKTIEIRIDGKFTYVLF